MLQWIARVAPAASLGAEAGRPARQAPGAAQRQAPNLPAPTLPKPRQTLSYLPQLCAKVRRYFAEVGSLP